ncbi:hypothetical protein VKT23_001034 [Stygiomarasmius scandens]|uniref:HCP-like protein n=1 Tax=Marasmiellus scandens TaxID=2682957 RepID=A0ABR1K636_9AGAR
MMAGPVNGQSPSAFHFASSPLDTLVRRTSSKKAKPPALSNSPSYSSNFHASNSHYPDDPGQPYSQSNIHLLNTSSPPRPEHNNSNQLIPNSPLLHSRFARDSVATTSSRDNNSFLDLSRASVDSRNIYQEDIGYGYHDDDSIYSSSSALRDSWRSGATAGPASPGSDMRRIDRPHGSPRTPESPHTPVSPVPTVVITDSEQPVVSPGAGRIPIVRPVGSAVSNFSRPVRPSAAPVLMPAEEQKQLVLERNRARNATPSTTRPPSPYNYPLSPESSQFYQPSTPSFSPGQIVSSPGLTPSTLNSGRSSPTPVSPGHLSYMTSHLSLRDSASATSSYSLNSPSAQSLSVNTASRSNALPRKPPSLRADSPVSVYSAYSYYNLDSATPSPTAQNFKSESNPGSGSSSPLRTESTHELLKPSQAKRAPETKAQEFLQLGIQHHEANRLHESAVYFERSAKEDGGCGVGKLMWGLTLRHGWGCDKNEKEGFKWLRKAAEEAVDDLETRGDTSIDRGAVRAELILAIYEVGQSYFHGWGVPKDQKMAVKYYRVAARLGDADAQTDLGFCLANGKGCKKDRKEAAQWYKLAVAQGASDVGLAWIYKDKFQ